MVDVNKIKKRMISYGENPKEAEKLAKNRELRRLAKNRGAKTPAQFAKMIKSFRAFSSA